MTQRERTLATGVLAALVLAGGAFLFNLFFLGPLRERDQAIETLKNEVATKRDRIQQVQTQKPKLERWRQESLPGDTDLDQFATTRRLYINYLRDLLQANDLASPTMRIIPQKPDTKGVPMLAGKKPLYTRLTFNVEEAHGNLDSLVTLLDRFYRSGMLHQVKKLTVQRPRTRTPDQQPDELDISMTVEGLVLNGTEARPYLPYVDRRLIVLDTVSRLRGAPSGLGLAVWAVAAPGSKLAPTPLAQPPRRYADIVARNIFFPAEEKKPEAQSDVTQFVYLIDITTNDKRTEAWLYNRGSSDYTRLRKSVAYDTFRVLDSGGNTLLSGKVIRIAPRDVYFQVDKKYYVIHVGQNLEEALRKPLSEDKIKEINAVAAVP
jgi:hypothetical protein